MSYWVKLEDGTVVSYRVEDPVKSSYYNNKDKTWTTATKEMTDEAWAKLIVEGYDLTLPTEKPPKPKRKELMRRLEELERDRDYWKTSYNEAFKILIDNGLLPPVKNGVMFPKE